MRNTILTVFCVLACVDAFEQTSTQTEPTTTTRATDLSAPDTLRVTSTLKSNSCDLFAKGKCNQCFVKSRLPVHLGKVPDISLTQSYCLPENCTAEDVHKWIHSLCPLASCLKTKIPFDNSEKRAPGELCSALQSWHCDPNDRLFPDATSKLNLICLSPEIPNDDTGSHAVASDAANSVLNLDASRGEQGRCPLSATDDEDCAAGSDMCLDGLCSGMAPRKTSRNRRRVRNGQSETLWITKMEWESLNSCGLSDTEALLMSGEVQDLGDYSSCRKSNRDYCTVRYFRLLTSGRCLPKGCSPAAFSNIFEFVCEALSPMKLLGPVADDDLQLTCFDFVDQIPLDLCLIVQLLGCGDKNILIALIEGVGKHEQLTTALGMTPKEFKEAETTISGVLSEFQRKNLTHTRLFGSQPDIFEHGVFDYFHTIGNDTDPRSYQMDCDTDSKPYWSLDFGVTVILASVFFVLIPKFYLSPLKSFQDMKNRAHSLNKDLRMISGLRIMSMIWIVVSHVFCFSAFYGVMKNLSSAKHLFQSPTFQLIISGQYAVDTFFFISAFLLTRSMIARSKGEAKDVRDPSRASEQNKNGSAESTQNAELPPVAAMTGSSRNTGAEAEDGATDGKRSFISKIGYFLKSAAARWLRLVPLLAFCMLFSYFTIPFMGSGPMWPNLKRVMQSGQLKGGCRSYWWANILMVNNLLPHMESMECFAHSWYLANDFQFSLIGSFVLIFCGKHRVKCILALIAIHIGACMYVVQSNDLKVSFLSYSGGQTPMSEEGMRSFSQFYVKPWCRFGAYGVGMLTAIIFDQKYHEKALSSAKLYNGSVAYKLGTPEIVKRNSDEKPEPRCLDETLILSVHVVAILVVISLLFFIPYNADSGDAPHWNWVLDLFYLSFSRTIWACTVAWFLLVSTLHSRDPISRAVTAFFCNKLFTLASFSAYGTYLIHPILQQFFYSYLPVSQTLTEASGWFDGIFHSVIGFGIGTILYIFVEVPSWKACSRFMKMIF